MRPSIPLLLHSYHYVTPVLLSIVSLFLPITYHPFGRVASSSSCYPLKCPATPGKRDFWQDGWPLSPLSMCIYIYTYAHIHIYICIYHPWRRTPHWKGSKGTMEGFQTSSLLKAHIFSKQRSSNFPCKQRSSFFASIKT